MLIETGDKRLLTLILFILILLPVATGLSAQSLSLSAELEQDEIWLGDSVQLTLYLQGSEDSIAPKLQVPGIDVKPLGGTVRSSRSITNINGKVTENVSKAYVYAYSLSPKHPGTFAIPSIEAVAEGQTLATRPLSLNVKEPVPSDDFSLNISFDREKIYLNEKCLLTISFLYTRSLRSLDISIPGLSGIDFEPENQASGGERYDININGSPVTFVRDDRGNSAGLTARLSIRPDSTGIISIRNATASLESVTGYQRVQDFFGRIQRQEVYGRSVIPGNEAGLRVLPFPEKGKPDDFFGLSGKITIDTAAEPDEVHIGDPITLTMIISGMNNTDIRIPPLSGYVGPGMDIPDTRASAKVSGNTRTITQTVRINDPSVQRIPSIRFSYFDTDSESYEYAESEPVPVKVLDTRVITAAELEGGEGGAEQKKRVLLEPEREGIYYNYTGSKLLEPERIMTERLSSSALIKTLLLLPVLVFLAVLIYTKLLPQIRQQALARVDRRKALKTLEEFVRKSDAKDPYQFLKVFNSRLDDFLKTYGSDRDTGLIRVEKATTDRVLYGAAEITSEEALSAAAKIVEYLKNGEASDVYK